MHTKVDKVNSSKDIGELELTSPMLMRRGSFGGNNIVFLNSLKVVEGFNS